MEQRRGQTTVTSSALESLNYGNFVFNAPEKMRWKQPQVVAAVLSASHSVTELEAQIKKYGKTDTAKVQITNKMEARLVGEPAFDVRPLTPLVQFLPENGTSASEDFNEWKWQVIPLGTGKQTLYLSLSIYIAAKFGDTPRVVKTLDRAIEVEVTTGERLADFWANNWQWLSATLVLPLAGGVWAPVQRWRAKKRRFEYDG